MLTLAIVRRSACALAFAASVASGAEGTRPNALAIARALDDPDAQWVFYHHCVPTKLLEGLGYTQGDFVDAYVVVWKHRWDAALDALARNEQRESMRSLAGILHGMIDAYWPGRIERDADGAIVRFRDCDELGGLQGLLSQERTGRGPDSATQDLVTAQSARVIRCWKERKPFDEVVPILRGGPMKIGPGAAAQPLTSR